MRHALIASYLFLRTIAGGLETNDFESCTPAHLHWPECEVHR
jgi:hypothetical protein